MRMRCRAVLFVASAIWLVPSAGVLAHVDVTPAEARELIDSTDDLLVVDVREPFEYCDERGHIPGAVNYPLTSGVLYARYEELPMDRPILVVCRSGGRSNVAATFLDDQGFSEVYDMTGGMNAWLWETAPCKYAGGSGTAEDPYQIATAADLIALGATPEDYDKHFILTADIDLDPSLPGGQVFAGALIAPDMSTSNNFQGTAFSGTFDGNGYRIANLTIDAGTGEYLGLFGSVTGMAVIDGVTLENVVVTGRKYVSGLIGYNVGTVSDCRVSCRLQGAGFAPWRFGGLVAFNVGSIHNCQVTGEIFTLDSSGYFGGLVGWNEGPIANSRAHVDIAGGEGCWEIGGLVGENRAPVTNCHAAGNVTGGDRCRFLGGLAGVNYDTILTNCSATGDVSAGARSNRMAGLVGGNPNATIVFCYATGDVTAGDSGSELGGLAGDNFGTITDCWAGGAISVGLNGLSAGGLIGYHGGSAANSYVTGAVSAGDEAQYVGALIGRGSGRVDGCFWDEETSGPIGSAAGQGLTTVEMQTATTFIDAGWDFVGETENGMDDIWKIAEGLDYPHLTWETSDWGDWIQLSSMKTARNQFAGAVIGDEIFVFGGNAINGNELHTGEKYSIATDTWSDISDNPYYEDPDDPWSAHGIEDVSGIGYNGRFYVFGAAHRFSYNEVYDPATNMWTTLAKKPTATSAAVPVLYEDEIYLFGGWSEQDGDEIDLSIVEVYDPDQNTWRRVKDMPKPLIGHAVAVHDHFAYLIGGRD